MIETDKMSNMSASLKPLSERKVVFISHANPEDNAITSWYGARLAGAGYEVWTDLTRLLGGEEMWRDIDDTLRVHARKVIVLLSRAVTHSNKEGVRAEIDRAAVYRRELNDQRFIIPVKIDETPHERLPSTISNRTIINGYKNPATALAEILKVLEEDGVYRTESPSQNALLNWHKVFAPKDHEPEQASDSLLTNWYPIINLPKEVYLYEINRPLENITTEPSSIAKEHPLPMSAHERRLITFAHYDEVQKPIIKTTPVKLDHSMSLDDFLSGGDEKIKLKQSMPKKHLSSLIRQAWDRFAENAGLKPFNISEKTIVWYVPKGFIDGDKVWFTRLSGVKGWRCLYGKYGSRGRNWHFGVTCNLMPNNPLRLKLTPHIVYTSSDEKDSETASYRRAHCKLWFNAKWRDLLYAYVSILCDNEGKFNLPFSPNENAIFSSSPISVTLPVRPSKAVEQVSKSKVEDDGDAQDIDISHLLDDPVFVRLTEEDMDNELDEFSPRQDDELEEMAKP